MVLCPKSRLVLFHVWQPPRDCILWVFFPEFIILLASYINLCAYS
uniref:Uncharacterized protein n=1 Tax=Arundo donax TaxID=35708 RepID=A0A0A9H9X2_ARUDO